MFSLSHNIPEVRAALHQLLVGDMPQITAMALNDTAYDALDAVKAEMTKQFDRPTRWTLNAFMVWRADARTLKAIVRERPSVGSRHYLKVQNTGGVRPRTGVESALISRLNYGGEIVAVTPAKGAKLDASGNWSTGQRNQLLSGVKAQRDATANTTAASRRRNRGRAQFFVPKPGSRLSPGVWMRDGDSVTKVLNFTRSRPSYTRRVNFLQVAETKAGQVFEGHLALRLATAMRRA
jgi:hypothetical protein